MDEWTPVLALPNLDMRAPSRRRSDGRDQDRGLAQSCRLIISKKKTTVTNAVDLCTWWVRNSEHRWVRFHEAEPKD
jgi:hypothetical protein